MKGSVRVNIFVSLFEFIDLFESGQIGSTACSIWKREYCVFIYFSKVIENV